MEARLVAQGHVSAGPGSYLAQRRGEYLDDLRRLRTLHAGGLLVELGGLPFVFPLCLRDAGWDVQVVDLAPDRLGALVRDSGLAVHQCDVERQPLPFGDGAAATVVLAATLEHLRVALFALEEIGRVLYLTTTNFYRLANMLRLLSGRGPANDPVTEYGKLRGGGHMGHVRECARAEVRRLNAACGFEQVAVGFRHVGNRAPAAAGWTPSTGWYPR